MAQVKTISFQWEGLDKRCKKIEGEMLGENSAIVKAQLRKQGIIPKRLSAKQKACLVWVEGHQKVKRLQL
jgi:type IV pilus assembly protein PilC